jgi:hypothetical protein
MRALGTLLVSAVLFVAGCGSPPPAPTTCRSSRECSAAGLVCDTVSMTCVDCVADTDCLDGTSACIANTCRAIMTCHSSRECPGLVCDTALGRCVDCVADLDCPSGQRCETSACVTPPMTCTSDRQCSGNNQVCDLVRSICVDCVRDTDCTDGTSCVHASCVSLPDAGPLPSTDQVDLLLMIDNSNSMNEEQGSVVEEIPRLVQILSSGDRNGDGIRDFTPATSLHLGIVDSDMGLGDVTGIATCTAGFGDDGLLQSRTRQAHGACLPDYATVYPDHVFTFTAAGGVSSTEFATDVGCVAALGTDGCGFEFELESPLKALSLMPTATGASPVSWTAAGYVPPMFASGTYGHGNDPATNGGFLRPTSVLAIVTVNDEDDCSTNNTAIFSPTDTRYNSATLNLRCHTWSDQLYPIQRYVDGFIGLRTSPARLVFAAVTGIPPDLAGMDPVVILSDPRMVEQIDGTHSTLMPVCTSPGGRGVAYPAIRMTRVAAGLAARGAHTTVQSICNSDYGPAFDVIVAALADAL